VFRVCVVDGVEGFEGFSELRGFTTPEEANARARREAADTIAAMAGGWRIVRQSTKGGLWGCRLESPVVSGSIVVVVSAQD
jgi:hypothetical protein